MSFLNPDDKTRIQIRKPSAPSAAPAGAPAAGASPVGVVKAGAPGVPGKPPLPGAKPGLKPGAPAPKPATAVVAIVKQKAPPKVEVLETAPGVFEVHFSCSCGEQYLIRCESADKAKAEEKSSAPNLPS
ncbi:hypothetical protein SAMN05444156_2841 [Verrucomicrobium sp. GAS474]|uniref:hypothetical protein n=1 Tax=Verrucomicrobium sp. GAS474 TaxID=1882831 RepID=UPI00087DCE96|nr:hypothetical protein [Verrucomicrobium sp. GAS474]SDU24730.1 hypothetical protein SAMN05444156_2841 [Verrucomicrobium sp. GAS474]